MRITTFALTAFLGFGCAAKKMAVKNVDFLLENQIEKHLPLNSLQEEQLAKDVDTFLNQQKVLAKEVLALILSLELSAEKVDVQYDKMKEIYLELSVNFFRLMSQHMASLSHKQQKDFEKILIKENLKLSQLKPNEQLKRVYDRFEMIFGSINQNQKDILKRQKNDLIQRHQLRLARRQKLHQRFLEIYQMNSSKESLAKAFFDAFVDYQKNYPEDERNKEFIKTIIPTLGPAQKKHFKDHTEDLQEILGYFLETNF